MSYRVTGTIKNTYGEITGLCGPDFGTVTKDEAISQFYEGVRYYVEDGNGIQADMAIYHVGTYLGMRKRLGTDPDSACVTTLKNLPDC